MSGTDLAPKSVIVLGFARSGTSMAAGVFGRASYFVTSDLSHEVQQADRNNPSGYWEAFPVLEANRRLLKRTGFEYDNTWMFDPISSEQAGRISDLEPAADDQKLVDFYEAQQPWVWKDPRFCYTLGYWWRLLDPRNTVVLLVTREMAEIQRSFERVGWRADTDPTRLSSCAKAHLANARALVDRYQIPCLEVDYHDFSRAAQDTAERIQSHTGVPLTGDDLQYHSVHNSSSPAGRVRGLVESTRKLVPTPLKRVVRSVLKPSTQRRF